MKNSVSFYLEYIAKLDNIRITTNACKNKNIHFFDIFFAHNRTPAQLQILGYPQKNILDRQHCNFASGNKLNYSIIMAKSFLTAAIMCVSAIAAVPAFAVSEETVLFEGSQLLEKPNGTYLSVDKSNLAGVEQNDVLTVYFNVADLGTAPTMTLQYGATKMACNATKTNTDASGNFAADATYTSTVIASAADVDGLLQKGLRITGRNINITKVILSGEGSAPTPPDEPEQPGDDDQTILSRLDIMESLGTTSWVSTYNADTHTITYTEPWGGCGWWFDAADYSQYTNVYVKCSGTSMKLTLTIEYNSAPAATFDFEKGVVNATLDALGKRSIKQMYIQGAEAGDVTVAEAEFREIEAPKAKYEVVWTGSSETGQWENDITIEASRFTGIKGGDKIKVSLSVADGKEFGNIELNDMSYGKLNCNDGAEGLNEYGCIDPETHSLTYLLSNADARALIANGLRVKGADITVTEVELIEGEALEPDPEPVKVESIWSGSVNCGNWAEEINVDKAKFGNDLKPGDKLGIFLTRNAGKGKGIVEVYDQNGAKLECHGQGTNMDNSGTIDKTAKEVVYTLNENDIKSLRTSGLKIKGFAVTVTGVTLQYFNDETSSAADAVAEDNEPAVYYNLNGIRVDNPAKGIYIKRQGSKVSKVIL